MYYIYKKPYLTSFLWTDLMGVAYKQETGTWSHIPGFVTVPMWILMNLPRPLRLWHWIMNWYMCTSSIFILYPNHQSLVAAILKRGGGGLITATMLQSGASQSKQSWSKLFVNDEYLCLEAVRLKMYAITFCNGRRHADYIVVTLQYWSKFFKVRHIFLSVSLYYIFTYESPVCLNSIFSKEIICYRPKSWKNCPFITLPQISSILFIPDTNDLENYGQGHKASMSIQMN